MEGRSHVGLVVLAAAVVGFSLRLGTLAPVAMGALLVVAHLGVWAWSSRRPSLGPATLRGFVGPIVISWLATSILPVHNFASRSSASATSGVSIQPVLELLVFTAVGLLCLAVIRSAEPTFARARPPMLLFLLPVWVVASSTWSETGIYTWVRGSQLCVVALLAWATVAIGRADRALGDQIGQAYLRWFVRITGVLVVAGFAFGPRYVAATAANLRRFTWIGAHPNGSGLVLSVAIVILAATPPSVLRLPTFARVGLGGALLVAMYDNHSRAAWLCLGLGLLAAFTMQGHLNRFLRWTGTPLLAAGAVAAVYFRGEEIWDYLLRDKGSDDFASGNGRKELWGIGFRALDTPFDWVSGLGYGITRTVFLEEAPWAGEAHNSVLSLLVGVGVIGVALLFLTLAVTLGRLLVRRTWAATPTGIAMTSLLVLVVVNGFATDILAEPTIGFVVMNLVAAVGIINRTEPVPARVAPAARPALRPRRYAGAGVASGAGASVL